jgi:hypothetical protein
MRGITRKRYEVDEQPPLGPEDDPYVAYLIWRAERDAAAAAARGEGTADADENGPEAHAGAHVSLAGTDRTEQPRPVRGSWLRRLARNHRGRAGTVEA